jgi:AcrR family transcriptional regulator
MLAQDLFVAQGYDETTIDDIAAAAGLSRRTLFRYFASKEDLVLGKYEILGDANPAPRASWDAIPALMVSPDLPG